MSGIQLKPPGEDKNEVGAPTAIKRLLVGRPMSSGEMEHTLLPKIIALPIFSSDALSSVAYASQETLLVLAIAGAAALTYVVPISLAVSALLAMVVLSYRETVRAYPNGGGAYVVAHENLGIHPGLLAAAALLIDYVLTVSVSIVAGVDAVISASPGMDRYAVELAIGFIVLVGLANLRGVRESGTFFAIPTYGFILSIYALLITGFVKCIGGCPLAESSDLVLRPEVAGLSLFIMLKAFAAGTTALTGVEAISNGVPAFRYPQSKNAAKTLMVMASISISMFIGISWLARGTQVVYEEHSARTVLAQIAGAVFGHGIFFYVLQVMTAFILILAANTAFAGFPRLASILAKDRFLPGQFQNLGDRLVFSNGIIILVTLSSLLVVAFRANLTQLIQLYLVGVFASFTLSQAGMVVHWRRTKERGWRRSAFVNGLGAFLTGSVLMVVVITKFLGGAWIVVAAIPVLMYLMHSVHRHYQDVSAQLASLERKPVDRRPGDQHMIILVSKIDAATARALGYVRSVRTADISAVCLTEMDTEAWQALGADIPLEIAPAGRSASARLKQYIRAKRAQLGDKDFLTLVIPEMLQSTSLLELLMRPALPRIKVAMLAEPGVQVLDIPILKGTDRPVTEEMHEPPRNYVCILVSEVNNATLQAIEYAETLQATDVRAVSFGLDPEKSERLGNEWLSAQIPHPLEIEASPFRDLGASVVSYIRKYKADGVNRVVTVVIPEKIVDKARHQLLHNQMTLIVKRRLLFEPGVVVVSVPYHIKNAVIKQAAAK